MIAGWNAACVWELFLLPIDGGLRSTLECLTVPDHAFAGVVGEFEILRELKGIGWTGIFAESTEHAAAEIVGEIGEFLAAGFLIALARNDNEVLGTCERAKVTGNAEGLVGIGIDVEPRRAAVALGDLGPLQRILLGVDFFRILVAERDAESFDQVDQEHLRTSSGMPITGSG